MAKRNGSQGGALDPALSQKKRARRRLIGAAALALLAAIVLPLVLDPEPRQAPGEVQVEIPSRDVPVASLAPAQTGGQSHSAAPDPVAGEQAPALQPAEATPAARSADAAAAAPPAREPAAGTPARSEPARPTLPSKAPVERSAPAEPPRPTERGPSGEPARQTPAPVQAPVAAERPAEQAAGRFAIQIGAYANANGARTMAERASKAGVRAYTEQINTSAGPRTRVRVGPFADRESAERARGRLTLVGIESSIVTLP